MDSQLCLSDVTRQKIEEEKKRTDEHEKFDKQLSNPRRQSGGRNQQWIVGRICGRLKPKVKE